MDAEAAITDDVLHAAWLYHVGQMSQEEVSRTLGISRFKVLRLLAEAREVGDAWAPFRSVATWYMWRSLDPIPVEY